MDVSTAANSWVDSYLEALISAGSRDALAARTSAAYPVPEAVDADRQICAKYYVNQILSLDEDSLRRSWNKVSRANRDNQLEKDARIEYLSWRVWAMKRKRAAVAARQSALRRVNATIGEEDDESDERTAVLYLDDLDTTVTLEPLTEEVDPADPAAAQLLAEPLSADQATVPDTDRPDDQSWDAVYPATAAAKASRAVAGATNGVAVAPAGGSPESLVSGSMSVRSNAGYSASPSAFSALASSTATPGTAAATTTTLRLSTITTSSAASRAASPTAAVAAAAATAAGRISSSGVGSQGAVTASLGPAATAAPSPLPPGPTATTSPATSAAVTPPTDADLELLVNRFPRLYVVLISLHGLVRGSRMELGRDPDTGGQVKYVVELARALGRIPSVARVDLLTRLIADPKVDASYSLPEERLDCGLGVAEPVTSGAIGAGPDSWDGGSGAEDPTGAFIVRLPCGPPETYLKKEDLWPHIREFADRAVRHVTTTLARLAGSGAAAELWAVHGHYADAGEAAALIAASLGCPMLMTGHSLGRNKKAHLLASGSVSLAEVEATYRISRRIEAEERSLDSAAVVFSSTQQEVKEQWGLYDGEEGYRDQLAAALTQRGVPGLHVPVMAVIPPGLDFSALKVALPRDPITQLLERHHRAALYAQKLETSSTRRGTPISLTTAPSLEAVPGNGANGAADADVDVDADAADEVLLAAAMKAPSPHKPSPWSPPGISSPAGGPAAPHVMAQEMMTQPCSSPPSATSTHKLPTHGSSTPSRPGKTSQGGEGQAPAPDPTPCSGAATPPLRVPRPVLVSDGGGATSPVANAATAGAASFSTHVSTSHQPRSPRRSFGGGGNPPSTPFASPPVFIRRGLAEGEMSGRETGAAAASPSGGALGGGSLPLQAAASPVTQPQPSVFTEPPIWREVHRFLRNPAKPVILAMSRPDAKKNVATLIKAYGSSAVLRDLANLVLVLGNRDAIDSMASGSARVMEGVLKLVDAYDLYGSVAYPKRHSQSDVSDIYHFAAATRGVFVNVALQEPFGLTLIEAAAHGVPIVATCHGGPTDIVATLRNGVTAEPGDVGAIATAITDIITRPELWDTFSNNGRNNILAYSWPSHVLSYLRVVEARRAAEYPTAAAATRSGGSPGPVGMAGQAGGGAAAGHAAATPGGGGGPPGCHGSPSYHLHLRTSYSLSYDDLSQLSQAACYQGTRLSLAGRSGGRWVVFCCDCDKELAQAGGALAALSAARRAAAEHSLPLTEAADRLGDIRLSALLRHALADVRMDAPAACLGLGVLSCLGCTDTRALLAAGGVALSELDFVSCNNGCQLWLTGIKVHRNGVGNSANSGDSGGGGGGGENVNGNLQLEDPKLLFDDRYERHMEYRWEATTAKQVVRRILSNRSGWGKLPLGQPGRPAPRISALGPYHIMVTFSGAAARDVNPTVLLTRFRRKLRLSGLRAQVVITPAVASSSCGRATSGCAGDGGGGGSRGAGELRANSMGLPGAVTATDSSPSLEGFTLHVVPLRCSRAMVLRYISAWYGIPLEDVTVVAFSTGGGHIATAALHCSDAEDLVAGQQRVVLMPEAPAVVEVAAGGCRRQRHHQQAEEAPPGIFTVDLSPYLTSGRVAVVD